MILPASFPASEPRSHDSESLRTREKRDAKEESTPISERPQNEDFEEIYSLLISAGQTNESPLPVAVDGSLQDAVPNAVAETLVGSDAFANHDLASQAKVGNSTSSIGQQPVPPTVDQSGSNLHEQMIAANVAVDAETAETETNLEGATEESVDGDLATSEQKSIPVGEKVFEQPQGQQSDGGQNQTEPQTVQVADVDVSQNAQLAATTLEQSVEIEQATVAQLAKPKPVAAQHVMQQIVEQTIANPTVGRQGDSTVTVRLDPPELGEVLIRLKKAEGGVTMRISALEETTQQLLQNNEDSLAQALFEEQNGMQMELGSDAEFRNSNSFEERNIEEFWSDETKLDSQVKEKPQRDRSFDSTKSTHDFLA